MTDPGVGLPLDAMLDACAGLRVLATSRSPLGVPDACGAEAPAVAVVP